MVRKEIFDVFEYKDSALSCEDYSLWSSILLEGYKITNIPNILLLYRTHDNQISTKNAYQQNINVAYLTQRILKHFNINSFEESILQLQRPAYSKNKYDKNVENLFKETFMLPSLNSKIFYKHLSEYCFISEKGFLFYKKFFSLKYLGTFTSNIVLVFLDKKLIKNLFYGKK